jgi:hypothetical protein
MRPSKPPSQPVPPLLFSLLSIFFLWCPWPTCHPQARDRDLHAYGSKPNRFPRGSDASVWFPMFSPAYKVPSTPPLQVLFRKFETLARVELYRRRRTQSSLGSRSWSPPAPFLPLLGFPPSTAPPSSFLFSHRAADTGELLVGAAVAPSPPSVDHCRIGMQEGLLRRPPWSPKTTARRPPSARRWRPSEDATGDPTEPLAAAIFFPGELPERAIQAAHFVQIRRLLSVIRPKGYQPITGRRVAWNFSAFSDFSIN